ncbi:MAG: cytochrome P450 [Blastomonas sp.]|jgi:cytochrome P450|uniref:cytochrome P450 n=1 Tax=Blastomonas TaxID=150203 RepID=UPI0006B8A0E6|nr:MULTISPECIES: cytochrome P450 [unclassified Blastomonas]AOG01108.1 cytochrome P450 family protein [Blastomonas sp. RAC04]KPF74083.1 cytochrome [Blastomonas sp. AAP25]MCO5791930.1 cytochrome P450 [Blastomonas sp.]
MLGVQVTEAPPHVPADLVRDYPIKMGGLVEENPFDRMIPEIHRTMPPIFYALDAYPGGTPAWIVRRVKDLQAIYYDTESFSNKDFAPFALLVGESWSSLPAETDPPMHGLYRKWVNPLFSPKEMNKLDRKIRDYARDYCTAIKARGSCEFMGEFAFEFPIKVFLELMGLPQEMTAEFLEWEMGLLHTNDLAVIAASTRKVVDYLRGEIADRKANPRDDLISYGVTMPIDGRPLTDDELVGFTFNLFIGGMDTVSTNMAWQFRHLATHPEDQAMLRAKPAMIPDAIEEMMRAYPAVTTFRTCSREVTIGGVTFQPGDKIAMPTSLAGRDPEEYPDADKVILGRKSRYLSFGYGPHLCVGMHLARREMRIALEEFLAAIPPFRIQDGCTVKTHTGGILQPETLPLAWD